MAYVNLGNAIREMIDASPKTISKNMQYAWKKEYMFNNKHVRNTGKLASIHTEYAPAFKEFIERKIEEYKPRPRTASKPETEPSKPITKAELMHSLELNVKALRAWGYVVNCTVQLPPKEL